MSVQATRGQVVRDEQGVRLVFVRSWPQPVEDVWSAVTDPERCGRWYGTWTGDPASGTVMVTMTGEDGAPTEPVGIEECVPPRRLVVRMGAPAPGESPWRLEVSLEERDGGTTLHFEQRLSEPYDARDIGAGWHYYLDRLAAVVTGAEVDQEWDDYHALRESYALS